MFVLYPNYKENKDKLEIDKGLIYTISNMIILANCGFSVDRMFSRAADIEQNKSIKKLMTNLLADIKFRGYNLEQALERLIVRNPSQTFSEILRGISNASWTSGDLKDILSYHFRNIEQIQKDETENMINSLTVLSEIYVALMVIAPIMIIIMFTLISVLNGTNPTSTISILNSITFILLPFVGVGFIVILDTMRGSD
jgi:archaellum biogenesis protein FlaJ (TadC family)